MAPSDALLWLLVKSDDMKGKEFVFVPGMNVNDSKNTVDKKIDGKIVFGWGLKAIITFYDLICIITS